MINLLKQPDERKLLSSPKKRKNKKKSIVVAAAIFVLGLISFAWAFVGSDLFFEDTLKESPTPTSTVMPSPTVKTTVRPTLRPTITPTILPTTPMPTVVDNFCGGIAGVACPAGYGCKLDGSYPDAGGTCVKDGQKSDPICIQVITPARNPATGEVRDFPTPCDVPDGWEKI